ncbi:hypothetical protein [Macrococcus animalis]|uniref:hypothetical protein n=1 Tax=Macrococcus animalis TaxID=3395467 RepID=UPI0039BEA58F
MTKYTAYPINKYDYAILERYMKQYHKLVKLYKNRPESMSDGYYERVSAIVLGITDLYNNQLSVFEQNLVKLTWWQCEDDKTISKVMSRGMPTIKVFQNKILCLVADATGYVR